MIRAVAFLLAGLSALVSPAMANTYAHFANGQALDPQQNDNQLAYLMRYDVQARTGWVLIERVPDGVEHNSIYSGSLIDGSPDFMNPLNFINPDGTYGDGTPLPTQP